MLRYLSTNEIASYDTTYPLPWSIKGRRGLYEGVLRGAVKDVFRDKISTSHRSPPG
jgi:hypothetical protein